jgi:hypothetical protein
VDFTAGVTRGPDIHTGAPVGPVSETEPIVATPPEAMNRTTGMVRVTDSTADPFCSGIFSLMRSPASKRNTSLTPWRVPLGLATVATANAGVLLGVSTIFPDRPTSDAASTSPVLPSTICTERTVFFAGPFPMRLSWRVTPTGGCFAAATDPSHHTLESGRTDTLVHGAKVGSGKPASSSLRSYRPAPSRRQGERGDTGPPATCLGDSKCALHPGMMRRRARASGRTRRERGGASARGMKLSEFIRSHKQELLSRWSGKVVERLGLGAAQKPQLIDELPQFLDEVIESRHPARDVEPERRRRGPRARPDHHRDRHRALAEGVPGPSPKPSSSSSPSGASSPATRMRPSCRG